MYALFISVNLEKTSVKWEEIDVQMCGCADVQMKKLVTWFIIKPYGVVFTY
jgi:hypothetical protein